MSAADAQLSAFIASMRALGHVDADAAKFAAPLVLEAAKKTAAAGTTPDGKAWPAKKDGGRALVHAADHLSCEAVGPNVVLTLTGPDVFHHLGAGVPKRQILPDGGAALPQNILDAMTAGAAQAFRATMGPSAGGGR